MDLEDFSMCKEELAMFRKKSKKGNGAGASKSTGKGKGKGKKSDIKAKKVSKSIGGISKTSTATDGKAKNSTGSKKALRVGTWCSGMECLIQALIKLNIVFTHVYAADKEESAQARWAQRPAHLIGP